MEIEHCPKQWKWDFSALLGNFHGTNSKRGSTNCQNLLPIQDGENNFVSLLFSLLENSTFGTILFFFSCSRLPFIYNQYVVNSQTYRLMVSKSRACPFSHKKMGSGWSALQLLRFSLSSSDVFAILNSSLNNAKEQRKVIRNSHSFARNTIYKNAN